MKGESLALQMLAHDLFGKDLSPNSVNFSKLRSGCQQHTA